MTASLILPEIACLGLLLTVFIADLAVPAGRQGLLRNLTLAGLAVVLFAVLASAGRAGNAFYAMYVADPFSFFFKVMFVAAAIFVTVMAGEFHRQFSRGQGEFYLLIVSALLGMLLIASVNDFILLFVAIELITLSFYVMTAYLKTDARSVEAGIKYLIIGSLSSGVMLYGISFIYGNAGSTNFAYIRQALSAGNVYAPSLLFGILLVIAGAGFKAGVVPFQFWLPDVYEGAPAPVTAYLATGSKIAGFAVLMRVFLAAVEPVQKSWTALFALLAAMTILYGNLGAIPQRNIKRFLGYSSIGHAGYLLIGIAAGGKSGGEAILFYLAAYLVTSLAAFLVVVSCSVSLGSERMEDYDGLAERSPLLAASMFLALLSLAGVPPLAGFFGKFLILSSAVEHGLVWLALLGAVNVVISLYYYLSLVKRMYIDPARSRQPIIVPRLVAACLFACLAGILVIGVFQGPFVRAAQAASAHLF